LKGLEFGTVEDYDALGFVGGCGGWGAGFFGCFAFVVFVAVGSAALASVSEPQKRRNGDKGGTKSAGGGFTSRAMHRSQMLTVFVGLEEQTTLDSKCKISSGGISAGKSTVSTRTTQSRNTDWGVGTLQAGDAES
jgi:hypothetical protein